MAEHGETARECEALQPCPFCGEKANTWFVPKTGRAQVACNNDRCGASGPELHGRANAIAAWNAAPRAQDVERLTAENERMRAFVEDAYVAGHRIEAALAALAREEHSA